MHYAVVVAGTLAIIVFSWFLSIKHGRYHGVARFFSFESIFIMALLNIPVWFHDPFSLMQMISWIFLILSLYIAIAGFFLLKNAGKPKGSNFEDTTVLVKAGLYRYIRHPLYLSLFLLGTGIMMKNITAVTIAAGAINLVSVWLTALIEEGEMIDRFGNDYKAYMKETRMFIPFLF